MFFSCEETLDRHENVKCKLYNKPLGELIYKENHSPNNLRVYKIKCKTEEEILFCQNLCLFSKCFIKDKIFIHDVATFHFFLLYKTTVVKRKSYFEFIGYFSKDADRNKEYNLSCLQVVSCFQGQGYGRFLISLSYLLSKKEGFIGGPETPVSSTATQAYKAYWRYTVLKFLTLKTSKKVCVKEISKATGIEKESLLSTLLELGILYQDSPESYFIKLDDEHSDWLNHEDKRISNDFAKEQYLL